MSLDEEMSPAIVEVVKTEAFEIEEVKLSLGDLLEKSNTPSVDDIC